MKKSSVLIVLLLLFVAGAANAAPVQWSANGHYYELIDAAVSWDDANALASASNYNGTQGHLATVTSAEENLFLTETFTGAGLHLHWTGGYQVSGSNEPSGGWSWVTGESFVYNNWESGEPNNSGDEMYLGFDHGISVDGKAWNDLGDTTINGYVVEYDTAPTTSVPEPASLLLLGLGVLGIVPLRRKLK